MKHCYLCRWSFASVAADDKNELRPVLKCRPEGLRENEQFARAVCKFYNPEEYMEELKRD